MPGDQTQVGLRFVRSERRRVGRPRLHLHLTSSSLEDQQWIVARVLSLGGHHADVGQTGTESFVVMADPEGNELCVIEPGNRYLAGTGCLGEVTCEGTRTVGLFWAGALGWPVVWDEGEQIAIQSRLGGTKIAWDSWDGSATDSDHQESQQRFDLVSDDPAADVERLLDLGATRGELRLNGVLLVDPDGNEFTVRVV